jgi:hypothetical protein
VEFQIPAGFALAVVACAVAQAFPGSVARLTVMGVATGAFAAWSRDHVAGLTTALAAWLFATGFLVNAEGELTFSRADAARLVVLLAAAIVGVACGVLREVRAHVRAPSPARARGPVRPPLVLERRLHPAAISARNGGVPSRGAVRPSPRSIRRIARGIHAPSHDGDAR